MEVCNDRRYRSVDKHNPRSSPFANDMASDDHRWCQDHHHLEVDGGGHRVAAMSVGLRRLLVVANCAMLIVGTTGGPLISRLYFKHGGHRQWFSSWLETGGWPLIFIPLAISYAYRRSGSAATRTHFITFRLFVTCAVLGVLTGADDFLYAYGLDFLPVSTSSILISTQLAFTAFFAYAVVRQKFTPYSLNAVALLTAGAVVLGLHTSSDRPAGVSPAKYLMGFLLTLGAAALYGLVLPLVELTYGKAGQPITYTLVMEMQLVMGFFATAFCTVGMLVNNDFKAIPREAKLFDYGEATYYAVVAFSAVMWQLFFLGAVGVISCIHALLAGVIIAVGIPVTEALAVVFFNENFSSEKAVSLVLSLWGLASYSYGEYRDHKKKKKKKTMTAPSDNSIPARHH